MLADLLVVYETSKILLNIVRLCAKLYEQSCETFGKMKRGKFKLPGIFTRGILYSGMIHYTRQQFPVIIYTIVIV